MNDRRPALQPLAQLATQNLKELHHHKDDGSRQIDELYAACAATGCIAKPALDVRARYERVFDFALEHHYGCWVVDYVEEVCGDTALMSNDPAEAQLLDGEFVRSWCETTLQDLEAAAVAALKSEQLFVQFLTRQLHKDLGKVSTLLSILEALGRIQHAAFADRKASASRRGVDAELKQAALLQKCFQAMAWCARHSLHQQPHTGRFSSVPDWMRQVHRRREKLPHGRTLFLDDSLQALHVAGAYPFSSLQNMLYMLFLTIRESDEEAWQTKLSLLLYYLLDLDQLQPGQQEDFRVTFSLPASRVASWQAMFLLDCVGADGGAAAAAAGSGPASLLAQACELLTSQVQGALPFKFIEVLVGLGRADVALSLHWAQAGPGAAPGPCSLAHAVTLLDLRLRCGLLVEAFLAMRSHCSSLPEPQRTEHARALVVHLAENAAAEAAAAAAGSQTPGLALASSSQAQAQGGRCQLQVLCELPWDPEEEDALVGWLVQQLQAGKPAGDLLPLYFLGRGRVPEALGAYNHWQLRGQASRGGGSLQASVDALVNAAAGLLPLPQRNVCVSQAPAAGGGAPEARWAVKLLEGLSLQADANVPVMNAVIHDGQPPPFMSSRLPPRPQAAAEPEVATTSAGPAAAAAVGWPPVLDITQGRQQDAAAFIPPDLQPSAALDEPPGPSLFSLPFASSQSSHLFPQPAYGAEAEAPPPSDLGQFSLFGPPPRQGAADARDSKRARTHHF